MRPTLTRHVGYFWPFQCSWSSHGNAVGIVTTLRLDDPGIKSREVQHITSRRTVGFTWPPIQLLLEKRVQGVELTTLLHLVSRFKMSGAVPLLRCMSSWPVQGQPSFNTCRTESKKLSEPKNRKAYKA